eukprot:Protomagalhaensia_wolfi_Nauph_80__2590@NODE_2739_length_1001_cov_53_825364_g328_i2_p1_GENE_NODE_2739_length_1001_cov_53_825364_g328_i2NODE_2739_length_1001_cov_53_825364_g328_i2_p1_ORF_typecomplete_len237_score38_59Methyltr_RsmBF/PF01189_17/2_7e31_NODE_2739_length_1001_cov_53_825364_g328_i248758
MTPRTKNLNLTSWVWGMEIEESPLSFLQRVIPSYLTLPYILNPTLPYSHCFADPASAFPVAALAPSGEEVILDLCAAPGGKSILMSSLLDMEKAARPLIVCNELSRARLDRLSGVLRAFVGEGKFQTINSDPLKSMASIKRYSPYSAALVDAPCSSDRHRVADGSIQNWKICKREFGVGLFTYHWFTAGSKRFQETQIALLMAAVSAVKRRGRIVYSTCSLSPTENDKVGFFFDSH